jgi:hypothetical protein
VGGEHQRDRGKRKIASIINVSQRVNPGGSYNQTGDKISFRRVAHVSTPVRSDIIVRRMPG